MKLNMKLIFFGIPFLEQNVSKHNFFRFVKNKSSHGNVGGDIVACESGRVGLGLKNVLRWVGDKQVDRAVFGRLDV